jgi:hypothetical protein
VGNRVLQAEKSARSGKGVAAKKPVGVVAAAKPHVNGGSAAPSNSSMKAFQSAVPKPGSRVTSDNLERMLAAMPGR